MLDLRILYIIRMRKYMFKMNHKNSLHDVSENIAVT